MSIIDQLRARITALRGHSVRAHPHDADGGGFNLDDDDYLDSEHFHYLSDEDDEDVGR